MTHIDPVDRYTYDAAYHALTTAGWTRDLPGMAQRVAGAVNEMHDATGWATTRRLAEESELRGPLVIALLAGVDADLWDEAGPLVDAAVAAVARAIRLGPNAPRYGYPLPA